jgi:hypothetical protein
VGLTEQVQTALRQRVGLLILLTIPHLAQRKGSLLNTRLNSINASFSTTEPKKIEW